MAVEGEQTNERTAVRLCRYPSRTLQLKASARVELLAHVPAHDQDGGAGFRRRVRAGVVCDGVRWNGGERHLPMRGCEEIVYTYESYIECAHFSLAA